MPARLIINADDFGLTEGINRSIEQLHRAGALSSATLMANGPAFHHAVAVAQRNPSLGVGCHVVLVDGVPVSSPESIPSLLGRDGKSLRTSLLDLAASALAGRLQQQHIRTEALAQVRKLQHAGISVTHLDTHKHTHIFPIVGRALLDAAQLTSVPAVRNPFEPRWSARLGATSRLRRLQVKVLTRLFERRFHANLRAHRVATTDGTVGIAVTGHMDAANLRLLLDACPDGTWELVCHPGYHDLDLARTTSRLRAQRESERHALLAVIPQALSTPEAPSLTSYGAVFTPK